jgi:hypothetical protein
MAGSPKAFISYAWSSAEHEAWVVELATRLVESGVDVVLDKWELREGQDKYHFMERMVSDPDVTKVIVISDHKYAERADQRTGGVGTESQIISREVYEKTDQQKFVPIVTELDGEGHAYLPTFLKSRIYIDMSNSANRYENFEQLVRWLFDRPLHKKPPLGKPPVYVTESESPELGTSARFRTAVDQIVADRKTALATIRDYLSTFADNLEVFRVTRSQDSEFDDQIYESIESFQRYRDEFIEFVTVLAKYRSDLEPYATLHEFFESLLRYKYPPAGVGWREEDFDNFRFFLLELFLYATAVLLKYRRVTQLKQLLDERYYVAADISRFGRSRLEPYDVFREYVRSLDETRNRRLKLNRLSVTSDMMQKRATRNDVTFEQLMQADFVLHLHSILNFPDDKWFPVTLLYATYGREAFELFARAASARAFEQLKTLLNVNSKEDLIERFKTNSAGVPYGSLFKLDGIEPLALMNAERLATEA